MMVKKQLKANSEKSTDTPVKIKISFNFVLENKDMEQNYGKSMTVPDMSFTLQEILYRFTRGASLPPINHNPEYDESEDFEDIDILRTPGTDLVDVEDSIKAFEERKKIQEVRRGKNSSPDITEANVKAKLESEASETSKNKKPKVEGELSSPSDK